MTTPKFGEAKFPAPSTAIPHDAFALVTGEVLQNARAEHPDRRFLVDENVQAVASRIHDEPGTQQQKLVRAAPYVGKWIVVRVAVGEHVSRYGMEIVSAQHPSALEPVVAGKPAIVLRYGLTCIFDSGKWWEALEGVGVGTTLTAMGQIEVLGPHEIRLRNCELV
jgi:hypothetical protein